MFWILTACLFILAASFVLLPLWLRNKTESFEAATLRKNENITLFQERSDELENDLASGNLEQAQFDLLILELQQSLLVDVADEDEDVSSETKPIRKQPSDSGQKRSGFSNAAIPVVFCLFMPVFAYSLYAQWGYFDDVELMQLFQRTADNRDNPQESQRLIVSLGEIVQKHNDRPWVWYFLAENFTSLEMFAEAEKAYQQSALRMEETPDKAMILGRVAVTRYILADFSFTPEISEVVEQALAINPNEISILYLLGADAEKRQDPAAAIKYWRLIIQSNPPNEQAQILRQDIAAAQQRLAANGQEVSAGPTVEIQLTLAGTIDVDENLRVFVAVRNAEREGLPPLAATDLTVADLPATIQLDNSFAVGPFNISSADAVFVSASVSFSGSATLASGDYRVQSDNFSHDGQRVVISLEISERLP